MDKFYILGILVVCFVIIRILFTSFFKRHEGIQEIIEPNLFNKEVKFSDEHINDKDSANCESRFSDENSMKPIVTSKNRFLYPDDDFGNLVKGTVYDSKTYDSEIIDNNKDKMKIITKKKKNNPK